MEGAALFGLETEYGFTPLGPDGAVLDRAVTARRLVRRVAAQARHLRDVTRKGGVFLADGLRVYLERGPHPEVSTPECSHPSEVLRHARAGEWRLARAVRDLERELPGSRILLSGGNLDYGGTGETWACHESYLHDGCFGPIVHELIPHLVSRIVFTGAGGFHNLDPRREFLISPRACQLRRDTFDERWFVNKLNEPLCRGYRRLHVVCGESLHSPLAAWLKIGTTALVVQLIEHSLGPGDALSLAHPEHAMLEIARDPSCRRQVKLVDGRWMSALEIQEHYLRAAAAQLGQPFMPPWAPEVCRRWRLVLERLRGAPDSVATTLDWAIKHAVFERQRAQGRRRAELYELDTRFREVGARGVFARLQRAGVLSRAGSDLERLDGRTRGARPCGRAALRRSLIRRLSAERPRYLCDWEGVIDRETATFADLRDPFETDIRWRPIEEGSMEWHLDGLARRIRRVADQASAGDPAADTARRRPPGEREPAQRELPLG